MGEVGLQYRILPEGLEVDLTKLEGDIKNALPDGARLRAAEQRPLAFGLKALHVLIVIDDKKGGADQVEDAISKVPGVQSVEIVEMGLL
ncbi:MAG: elongation factor 1-beta [Thermoplasmatota archaeon]|nr:elongation factor 1-beta [Candidatus Thermoplasmatota archaeon]MBU1915139.1 elongation factor 1-beta [Candidatus Thermoplasmatota archaeon]